MPARLPHLTISIPAQRLGLCLDESVMREFPVSTSKFGVGMREGSNHTPTGNFVVSEKHGQDAAAGTSFKGRVAQGLSPHDAPCDEDLVLTRILRLTGLDPANENTYERYIYLHGTNQEDLIGTPASHGCIRMMSEDIIELYDLVPVGSTVSICD